MTRYNYTPSRAIIHLDNLNTLLRLVAEIVNIEIQKATVDYEKIVFVDFIYATGSEVEIPVIKSNVAHFIKNICRSSHPCRIHIGHGIYSPDLPQNPNQYTPNLYDGFDSILDNSEVLNSIYQEEYQLMKKEGLIQGQDVQFVPAATVLVGFDLNSDEEYYESIQTHYGFCYDLLSRKAIISYTGFVNYGFDDSEEGGESD